MDLFSETNPTAQMVEKDLKLWVKAGYVTQEDVSYVTALIDEIYDGELPVYPPKENVLKAFRITNPKHLKVIILGQDPYPNDNANGLAFDCAVKASPSLNQIVHAIRNDLSKAKEIEPGDYNNIMNLSDWGRQGVLLLNTVLTVGKESGSHFGKGWDKFINNVLSRIGKNSKINIVWLLWGSKAQKYNTRVLADNHMVLGHEHPVSASYRNGIWGCTHFSMANNYLRAKKRIPVTWVRQQSKLHIK